MAIELPHGAERAVCNRVYQQSLNWSLVCHLLQLAAKRRARGRDAVEAGAHGARGGRQPLRAVVRKVGGGARGAQLRESRRVVAVGGHARAAALPALGTPLG